MCIGVQLKPPDVPVVAGKYTLRYFVGVNPSNTTVDIVRVCVAASRWVDTGYGWRLPWLVVCFTQTAWAGTLSAELEVQALAPDEGVCLAAPNNDKSLIVLQAPVTVRTYVYAIVACRRLLTVHAPACQCAASCDASRPTGNSA